MGRLKACPCFIPCLSAAGVFVRQSGHKAEGEALVRLADADALVNEFVGLFNVAGADCESIEGVENFPWVTNINLNNNPRLKKVDISRLHNVTTVQPMNCKTIEEIICGDNNCTVSFYCDVYSSPYSTELVTISGENVHTISGSATTGIKALDITQCPGIKSVSMSSLDMIYVTAAQKENVSFSLPGNTEYIIK